MSVPKKHAEYRTFGAYRSLREADDELSAYWLAHTPEERMEALEQLRIQVYGEKAIDSRISRIFGVPGAGGS